MPRAKKKSGDLGERVLRGLARIEDLLVDLIVVQAVAADADRNKVARLLGVHNRRVSRVSASMKRKKAKK